jgi:hypothetical protein
MSYQPFQFDTLKDNVSSTYNAVSDKVSDTITPDSKKEPYDPNTDKANFRRGDFGNTVKKGDLKDQLNEAACGSPKKPEEGYVEKGTCLNTNYQLHRPGCDFGKDIMEKSTRIKDCL